MMTLWSTEEKETYSIVDVDRLAPWVGHKIDETDASLLVPVPDNDSSVSLSTYCHKKLIILRAKLSRHEFL